MGVLDMQPTTISWWAACGSCRPKTGLCLRYLTFCRRQLAGLNSPAITCPRLLTSSFRRPLDTQARCANDDTL